jgi:hypothetical protein
MFETFSSMNLSKKLIEIAFGIIYFYYYYHCCSTLISFLWLACWVFVRQSHVPNQRSDACKGTNKQIKIAFLNKTSNDRKNIWIDGGNFFHFCFRDFLSFARLWSLRPLKLGHGDLNSSIVHFNTFHIHIFETFYVLFLRPFLSYTFKIWDHWRKITLGEGNVFICYIKTEFLTIFSSEKKFCKTWKFCFLFKIKLTVFFYFFRENKVNFIS